MWELIKSLRDEGKTIVMTTHYMEEAEYLCDRICIMSKSEIAAIGTIKELAEQAAIDQKITFACEKANKENLFNTKPGLEDVFLKITGYRLGGKK